MSNSIQLKFNFNSEIPSNGGPNQYENLAPGNKVLNNLTERLKNSLRAERFETYEATFKAIVDLIGYIDFKEYEFSLNEKTIGKILDDLLTKINSLAFKLKDGSFPIEEIYTPGIIRNYVTRNWKDESVVHLLNHLAPGRINYCPEFDIIQINDRTIKMSGGKTITNKGITSYFSNSLFEFTLDVPTTAKNVEFDEINNIYEKLDFNLIRFKLDGTNFIGRIPFYKNRFGIPFKLPVKRGGMGNSKSFLFISETDIQVSIPDTILEIVYDSPDSNEFYIKIPAIAIDPILNSLIVDSELPLYGYWVYSQWRIDTIAGNTIGELKLFKGNPEEENPVIEDGHEIFYQILVSSWKEKSSDILDSELWSITSNILPANLLKKNKENYIGDIFDKRKYFDNFKVLKETLFELSQGKVYNKEKLLITNNEKIIKSSELETEFGKPLIIKNPSVLDFSKWKKEITSTWTSFQYPGNLLEQQNILENNFIFSGLSFKLGKFNGTTWEEVISLSGSCYLEYELYEEGNLILHGKTTNPQASIPEELLFYNKKIIKFNKNSDYLIQVRMVNSISPDRYFIFSESEQNLKNVILPSIYTGSGYYSELNYIDNHGNFNNFGLAEDTVTFALKSTEDYHAFSESFIYKEDIIGTIWLEHNYVSSEKSTKTININSEIFKWVNITLELIDYTNSLYKFKVSRKILIPERLSDIDLNSSLSLVNISIVNGFIYLQICIDINVNTVTNIQQTLICNAVLNISDPELVVSYKILNDEREYPITYNKFEIFKSVKNRYIISADNNGTLLNLINTESNNVNEKQIVVNFDRMLNIKGYFEEIKNGSIYNNHICFNLTFENSEYSNIYGYNTLTGLEIKFLKLIDGNEKKIAQPNYSNLKEIFNIRIGSVVELVYAKIVNNTLVLLHYITGTLWVTEVEIDNGFTISKEYTLTTNFTKDIITKFYADENSIICVGKTGTQIAGFIYNNENYSNFVFGTVQQELNLKVNFNSILIENKGSTREVYLYKINREFGLELNELYPRVKDEVLYLGDYTNV